MAGTYTEARASAVKKYQEANKEKVAGYHKKYESQFASYRMRMTKEQKEILDEKAKEAGKSINQYIIDKLFE